MMPGMTDFYSQTETTPSDPDSSRADGDDDVLVGDDTDTADGETAETLPDPVDEDDPDGDDPDGDVDGHGAAYIEKLAARWAGTGGDTWDAQTQAAKTLFLRSEAIRDRRMQELAAFVYPDTAPAAATVRLACSGVPKWLPTALSAIESIAGTSSDLAAMALARALPQSAKKHVEEALGMFGAPVGDEYAVMPGADIVAATNGVTAARVASVAKSIAQAQALKLTDGV